jgi:Zn-finger nucleic acid-binding protein
MTELTCPTCHTALRVARDPRGAIWVCQDCAGAAASLAVLRKRLKTGLATDFWRKVLDGSVASQRPCPSCDQSMRGFAMPLDGHTVNLDLCKKCQFVWFDGGELEALPKAIIQNTEEETRRRKADAAFTVQLQRELKADREAKDTEYCTNTIRMALEIIVRLLLRA